MVFGVLAETELYVAADAAAGRRRFSAPPLSNVGAVVTGLRSARKAGTVKSGEQVTVYVEPGVYPLADSFELSAEDGGTAAAPVVYRAQKRGKAHIQGGIALDPSTFVAVREPDVLSRLDESVRGKVLVCDLSGVCAESFPAFRTAFQGVPAAPWLYVDRQPMTLARWPNNDASNGGWAKFSRRWTPVWQRWTRRIRASEGASGLVRVRRSASGAWNLAEGVGCWATGHTTGATRSSEWLPMIGKRK
jgi:hypothetical protein